MNSGRISGLCLFIAIAVAGCGDQSGSSGIDADQNTIDVRFTVPWTNRLGRDLSSAEVRFHGLAGRDALQRVGNIQAAKSDVMLVDDAGNLAWVYHLKNISDRSSGVIEISASVSSIDIEDADEKAGSSRYLEEVGLTDSDRTVVDGHLESVCQGEAGDALVQLRDLYQRDVNAGDEQTSPKFSEYLIVAIARECKLPARMVVGIEAGAGTKSGIGIRKWVEVYVEDAWHPILPADMDSSNKLLRMRIVQEVNSAMSGDTLAYVIEAVGVNVDPGAIRIAVAK